MVCTGEGGLELVKENKGPALLGLGWVSHRSLQGDRSEKGNLGEAGETPEMPNGCMSPSQLVQAVDNKATSLCPQEDTNLSEDCTAELAVPAIGLFVQ